MCPLAWPPFLPASACFSPRKTLERPFPFRWWNGGGARAGQEALESRPLALTAPRHSGVSTEV